MYLCILGLGPFSTAQFLVWSKPLDPRKPLLLDFREFSYVEKDYQCGDFILLDILETLGHWASESPFRLQWKSVICYNPIQYGPGWILHVSYCHV